MHVRTWAHPHVLPIQDIRLPFLNCYSSAEDGMCVRRAFAQKKNPVPLTVQGSPRFCPGEKPRSRWRCGGLDEAATSPADLRLGLAAWRDIRVTVTKVIEKGRKSALYSISLYGKVGSKSLWQSFRKGRKGNLGSQAQARQKAKARFTVHWGSRLPAGIKPMKAFMFLTRLENTLQVSATQAIGAYNVSRAMSVAETWRRNSFFFFVSSDPVRYKVYR